MDFKKIHLGSLIKSLVIERNIEISRFCNYLKCTEQEISEIYLQEHLSTDILLKISKLLEYDFFRIYSSHLILYSPPSPIKRSNPDKLVKIPNFRKNIYTKEIIEFIVGLVMRGEKTKNQIVEEYRIPKTTLYKWISKYKNI